ncbi:unnamed protein product [Euphydryas editha]|uniref:Major facilitator superfamily (MFS) profile domain-containing protein n=1 Tax=Euphydryas editha TaxID=104508 RepID=A0AAU9V5B2_EUPED|nr:unnamed protein product [Euphydryas editha]
MENLLENKDTIRSSKKNSSIVSLLRSCCFIPQRYTFAIVALIGLCNAFTMRTTLNIAITQMVKQRRLGRGKHLDPDACPSDMVFNTTTFITNPHAIFNWEEKTQGLLLSGFYYGYFCTQILGGFLALKFGSKWVLGIGLLSTAIFTFLTPIITRTGGSTWLFILRIVEGMGEGPTMPALAHMMARWIPPHERSILSAIIFGGGQFGNIFGPIISGILLDKARDWAYVFYFFGAFGLFWFTLWSLLCYSEPNEHPFISKKELQYLNQILPRAKESNKRDPVPWKAIIRSPPAWAMLACNVGHDWGLYTIISDLPKYTHDVLKFNIATAGILSGLPFMAMTLCATIFGIICDFGIRKKWHSVKTARKIYTSIAGTGPAIFIILASYSGCNRNAAMVCFIISMGLMGAYYSGMKVNVLEVAPNYAGTLTSFINTVSTLAGIITPYLTGLLTPDSTLIQWRTAFWVCFAMLVGSNIIYCIWMKGEQVWWDDVRKHGYPPGWKHGSLIRDEETKSSQDVELIEKI